MINLVLITSIIDMPNKPFNYTNVRSVFTREQRFNDTKKTIESIKKLIPNYKIVLVECSKLLNNELEYLKNNSDYLINLYENKTLHDDIFGLSKSLGEGTMTIKAIEFIYRNDIKYDNFIKISGRYWLSDKFDYNNFNNNKIVVKKINNNKNNILTAIYKIPYNVVPLLNEFLSNNLEIMKKCIGYEILYGYFINFIEKEKISDILYLNIIGVHGYVSVSCDFYSG